MPIDRDGEGPSLRREDPRPSAPDNRGGDLRATPFTDDVFDDDYYGRRGRSSAGGSRSLSVVIGVGLGIAVAGGIGWYFFGERAMNLGASEGSLIKAESTPYKIRPDSPGGLQVENQDKLVYDRLSKSEAPSRVENLLPPAEEPKAPPVKAAEPPKVDSPPAEVAKAEVAKAEPPKTEVAKVEAPPAAKEETKPAIETAKPATPPAPTPPLVAAAAPEPPAKPAEPEPDPLAAAVLAAAGGRTSATGPIATTTAPVSAPEAAKAAELAPQTADSAPETPTSTPETAPPAVQTAAVIAAPAAQTGAFQVQLVSVLSEEAANAEWKRISGKNKDLLGTLSPAVTKADLGEKGIYYRLRAGPLADKAAADTLCTALAAQNVGCIVVKP